MPKSSPTKHTPRRPPPYARPQPYVQPAASSTMQNPSPTKHTGRPLPYARPPPYVKPAASSTMQNPSPTKHTGRPTTMVSTPQTTQPPHHQVNDLSVTDPSTTNPQPPHTTPNPNPSPTTTTTTAPPALTSPPPSTSKVYPPDYTTWHPVPVLHSFNLLLSIPIMPLSHPMMQELLQDPLPPDLKIENDLRILVLDDWWKKQMRRTLPLEPLHQEERTGQPESGGGRSS
ncbi:MAG: hypothetical protein Q9184_000344 [Pyrenodesmia sp. 2 TL-2023]